MKSLVLVAVILLSLPAAGMAGDNFGLNSLPLSGVHGAGTSNISPSSPSVQGYYLNQGPGHSVGNVSVTIPWNSGGNGPPLTYAALGLVGFGVQNLAKPGGVLPGGIPNATYEHLRWIVTTGRPFSSSNSWEQNSGGKPLVFINLYGHGMLGILNMEMADKLFPGKPLLAVLAASLMYDLFEFYGEGSNTSGPNSGGVIFENNDFIISQVIPIMGSQAFADALKLNKKLDPSVVASAQTIVYALMSGKKMDKKQWLELAAYPALIKLYDCLKFFRGKNGVLDQGLDHMATTFGFSSGIGGYVGVGYSGVINGAGLNASYGVGPGGQRVSLTFKNKQVFATAFGEMGYQGSSKPPSVGGSLGFDIGRPQKSEMERVREYAKKRIKDYFKYSFEELGGSREEKELKANARAIKESLLDYADSCRAKEDVYALLSGVGAAMGRFHKLAEGDMNGCTSVLAQLGMLKKY